MTTYNTMNPVPSSDARDRYDNSENLDNFSNGPLDAYPDRFGVSRQSLQGIRNASQYVDLGPYAAGLNFTSRNQVFSYDAGSGAEFYAPGPSITLPYTTTGAGAGEIANFRSVGDAILRSDLAASDGAELVGYGGRSVAARLDDARSVLDFGAAGDGVADDTAAFSAAAKAAIGFNNIPAPENNINRAHMCSVNVPAGDYRLTAEVDTGGKEVTWVLDPGAAVVGFDFINGTILRPGQRQNDYHHGTTDYACSYSIRSNGSLEESAEILGISSPEQLGVYTDRDSVSLFVDNTSPPVLVDAATATYTATTVALDSAPPAASVLRYRVGMIVDTKHAPKWSGFIESWSAAGDVITVSGWHRADGVGTAGTPANGTGAYVNPITKIWAHNANVTLTAAGHAIGASGFELGMLNQKGASSNNFDDEVNRCWGFDSVNLGTYKAQAAFVARGEWHYGYLSRGQDVGFKYISPAAPGVAYAAVDVGNNPYWVVNQGGSMEIGGMTTAAPVVLDFHSSGNINDYDARLLASGGGAGSAQGSIQIDATVLVTPTITSSADAVSNLGSSAIRWNTIYASSGTINTSDAREKTSVIALTPGEINAAKTLGREIGTYKFLSAVAAKGTDARNHIGMTVQRAIEILLENSLDPMSYGFICYDEWEATSDQFDGEGNVVVAGRGAGSRYGFRMDEMLAFIAAGFEARLSALESV